MFDIGFSELVVVFIVALVVLGPERLPKAARLMGALIGKIRRTTSDLKYEFNREIELQEMKQRIEALQKQMDPAVKPRDDDGKEKPSKD